MILEPAIRAAIVGSANRAPSVHNTQPARWAFDDGGIQIYADKRRFLNIGDPTLQDAGLSCGAALEGTIMSLADHGIKVAQIEDGWDLELSSPYKGMKLAARLTLEEGAIADSLSEFIDKRFTWRGAFNKAGDISPLLQWGEAQDDITLVSGHATIADLALLNDVSSLKFFKNRAYREELLSYMRLSKNHPLWNLDGLNRESMHLSSIQGGAANIILRHPMFEIVNKIGLGNALVSEAAKTRTASAIAFFTVPKAMSPIDMGRAFYRRWLEITRLGYAVWPMAVIADDKDINELCCRNYEISNDRKLINVFRIGPVPNDAHITPARLATPSLILNPQS